MNLSGYWDRYSTGSTFESINSNDIKNAEIVVPIASEQSVVGRTLEKLDSNIDSNQRNQNKPLWTHPP